MKRLLSLLLLCGLCHGAVAAMPKQFNDPKAAPDGSRFLFIVDISSSMRGLQEASRQAMFDMVFTGLGGQMRTGDTFGIWTFNEDTYAGQFPMQVWDAQNPMEVASRAALFLSKQKYSGESHVENLVPKVRSVVRGIGDLTIFLISDGNSKFADLSFAEAINTEYRQRAKERSKAKKPFVTALIAHGGKIGTAYVAIAGQALPLPDRPAPAVAAAKKTSTIPANAVTNGTTTVAAVPAPPAASVNTMVTPAVTVTAPPTNAQPLPTPAVATSAANATETNSQFTAPDLSSEPKLADAVAAPPTPPRQKVIQIVTRSNAPAPNETIMATSTTVAPKPATNATTNATTVVAHTEVPEVTTHVPAGPKPVPAAIVATLPTPLPVAGREVDTSEPSDQPKALNAVAMPAAQGLSAGALFGIGGLLLAASAFLIIVVLRGLRSAPQPSFITRSMERRS